MRGALAALARLRRDAVLGDTAYLVTNTASLAAFGFAFWVLAARRFTPEDVGIATALISTTQLATLVATGGIHFSILKHLPAASEARRSTVINSALAFTAIFGLVVGALAALVTRAASPEISESLSDPAFVAMFAVLVAFQGLSTVVDGVFTAVRRSSFVLWKNTVGNVFKIALVIAIPAALGSTGIFGANSVPFVAIVVGSVAVAIGWTVKGHRRGASPDVNTSRELVKFGTVAHASNLMFMAPQLLLPVLLLDGLGAAKTAFLYTSWKLAGLLWVVTTAAAGPLLAFGSADRAGYPAKLKRTLGVSTGLTAILVVAGLLAGPLVLQLFGDAYASASRELFVYLLLSSVPLGIFAIYQSTLRVYSRTVELIAASAVFCLLASAAFLYVKPLGTLESAGWAWLGSTALAGVVAAWRLFGAGSVLSETTPAPGEIPASGP